MAYDLSSMDTFYLYNPDTLIRIYQPTVEYQIEQLYMRKRFDQALKVLNNSYGRPMHDKVQKAHLNHLVATNQIDKMREVITAYLGHDRDAWVHWLSRILNKRMLSSFISLIPIEQSDAKQSGAPR